MNIQIPEKYKDLHLKENEAVIVAFMTMIANKNGFEDAYNISSYDFKKIMGGSVVPRDDKMPRIKQVLSIIALNDCNWILKFKDWAKDSSWYHKNGRGKLKLHAYKLTSTRNIAIWCYLMGVWMGTRNLVEESYKLFEHESDTFTMDGLELQNFRLENRARDRVEATS